MRIGCCSSPEDAPALKSAGFAFVEVHIQKVLQGDKDDAAWSAAAPDPDRLALPIHAANCLLLASQPVIGPLRDIKALGQYMQRVAHRARVLGIQTLVFGSGKARERPADVAPAMAMDHLVEFTRLAGEACGSCGVRLVIEHLRGTETNTLNKVAEALELAERVDHPAVGVLVDSYHFGVENDRLQSIVDLGPRLAHVHVAEPVERIQPGGHGCPGDDPRAFDFAAFFRAVRQTGYDGNVSFEGRWKPSMRESAPAMIDYLRRAWDVAGA